MQPYMNWPCSGAQFCGCVRFRADSYIVQWGGNQEPTQKSLKRLTNLLVIDAAL
jgi:hypothetical protein